MARKRSLCKRFIFAPMVSQKLENEARLLGVSDGDLDLHAGLDGDGGDLLHDLGGRVQVNDALVDPHLRTPKENIKVNDMEWLDRQAGADIMITLICDFRRFPSKNWRFL
jgi:hypothetical protein